jgi:hypothetical protein
MIVMFEKKYNKIVAMRSITDEKRKLLIIYPSSLKICLFSNNFGNAYI